MQRICFRPSGTVLREQPCRYCLQRPSVPASAGDKSGAFAFGLLAGTDEAVAAWRDRPARLRPEIKAAPLPAFCEHSLFASAHLRPLPEQLYQPGLAASAASGELLHLLLPEQDCLKLQRLEENHGSPVL